MNERRPHRPAGWTPGRHLRPEDFDPPRPGAIEIIRDALAPIAEALFIAGLVVLSVWL